MEKVILKETVSKEKPTTAKKKTYKPRKKKEMEDGYSGDFDRRDRNM